ncbi:hypothetical protein chiPu_0001969 [Chiloscyllium punctatum]|uniref:Uncharacterized protein n=1 Tax=Chiloscyllium punctatum TaxID=137246 RepID=A0A401RZK1_CHIPU|nr:hypothetical protein [Chiloscyllium punctatum]
MWRAGFVFVARAGRGAGRGKPRPRLSAGVTPAQCGRAAAAFPQYFPQSRPRISVARASRSSRKTSLAIALFSDF